MSFFRQLVMGVVFVVMAECPLSGQEQGKAPEEFEGATPHCYKKTAEGELYLHVFLPQKGRQRNRPAALFFFGGSWNGGTPGQFAEHASYLASRGMVGIVVDYRVNKRQGTSPFECVKDGKSAIRWVRSRAVELGIDPDRIAAGGGSAGGHVAAATATVPGLEEEGEDRSVSCRPNALLLFNPVYDNGPGGFGHERVKERYKEISPIHNIHKGTPPAIVFLGTNDSLIPVATAEKYKKLMEQAGSRCDLHLYEGQPHGFFNRRKSEEHFLKTVTEMDRFLESLGYLKGEPTIR
ncbi:MAG: alpha/beta hydrolase [Planctomycetota bacterium]|nr:alpha/beta hydrolase [Planctomycetota bacterium]